MAEARKITKRTSSPAKKAVLTRAGSQFRKLSLPRVRTVELRGFSLYERHKTVGVTMGPGTTCLAGANGIGKSTFLAGLMFGITGSVPVPASGPESESISEYRKRAASFTPSYFTGRISETDRARATVSLELEINDQLVRMERSVFEPGLKAFSVAQKGGGGKEILRDARNATVENRLRAYETWLVTQVGLQSFDQFVFLHHFVLMFDESRHLLFWDTRATEQALFLVFGGNKEAEDADLLRRQMERADSRVRNTQFMIHKSEKRIEEIQAALGLDADASGDSAVIDQIESLVGRETTLVFEIDSLNDRISDNALQLADRAAQVVTLRDEYAKRFESLVASRADPENHPTVRETLTNRRCAICGSTSSEVTGRIQSTLAGHRCPLCDSSTRSSTGGGFHELSEVDQHISAAQHKLSESNAEKTRLVLERTDLENKLATVRRELRRLEKSFHTTIARIRNRAITADQQRGALSLDGMFDNVKQLKLAKAEATAEREEKKRALKRLQVILESRYALAEKLFLPAFKLLAQRFLGIDLVVRLQGLGAKLTLVIEVARTARREKHQLSESQRFFVDIALRMALAQFMSSPQAAAPLYIDTPEGSLDIAYESQAGAMFADFVNSGHQLTMTANINASELVQQLARVLGKKRFQLERMTDWARLSEVQRSLSGLFDTTYKKIEKATREHRA